MNRILYAGLAVVVTAAALICTSCEEYDGTIKTLARDITIDIDNSMFLEPEAGNAWEQGPGVDEITITIVLDSGNVEAKLSAADIGSGDYSQITQEVTGTLERVDVLAVNAAGNPMTDSVENKDDDETFDGWQTFANLQRFVVDFSGDSADSWASGFLSLNISPRGGTAVSIRIDSGVTDAADAVTDWAGDAQTIGQLAVEPVLSENPAGLTFDVYYAIVNEDLRELYKPEYATDDANYEHYPWEDVWTYTELTSSGKQISARVYTMAKYNAGDPWDYVEPAGDGCGYNSFLIDLTSEEESPIGKYLMIALVSKYDNLSVPSRVEIIEIE